jgi:hypothetical protein
MLKNKLTGRDGRAIKVAAAAIAAFLLLRYLVLPIWDRAQDARVDIGMQEQTLGKFRRAVATAGPRAKEAEDMVTRLRQAESRLLEADSDALASAELEKLVKEMATTNGIDLKASEFNKAIDGKDGYKEIPVGIGFQCRLDQLVNFLSSVQASDRLLSVSKLAIQPAGGPKKEVVVSMTIGGWLKSAGAGRTQTQ